MNKTKIALGILCGLLSMTSSFFFAWLYHVSRDTWVEYPAFMWGFVAVVIFAIWATLLSVEGGRSQAFELAVKFNCFPVGIIGDKWIGEFKGKTFECKDPQTTICIAATLTAQELRK